MHFDLNCLYHIYNRSFNRSRIFLTEKNYLYFINKIKTLKEHSEIIAYCLMPDHFHLMIYIPENSEGTHRTARSGLTGTGMQVLSRKIGTILSSYTQAINKQEKRGGSLFQPKTKQKKLSDSHAFSCFHYIHQNPLRAGLINKIEAWRHSSFNEYYQNMAGICNKEIAHQLIDIPSNSDLFYQQSYNVVKKNSNGKSQ